MFLEMTSTKLHKRIGPIQHCAFNLCSIHLRFILSFKCYKSGNLKKESREIKLNDVSIVMTLFDRQSHVKYLIYEDGESNL